MKDNKNISMNNKHDRCMSSDTNEEESVQRGDVGVI